ncbi:MAG: ORF6N domain-containing protein [Bacteroidetes bacterium]|nr:ORF6N domain-containing protein [Bacteroidota bacterium]MBS1642545.1 ORF6N domain-containing protein [Bacteroidota bacterium]MBS1670266.1 ORF6N domain-containing protein [Bacteroidota bacterium]
MKVEKIHSKIYDIRGEKVMLDFDLAELYEVETKYLKRAVKSNLKRFPKDFMFELTREEFLRCKFSTSKRGGTRYMPFAFTEHGVTMLAAVLNSDKAIEMNIAIIRAFIALRQLVLEQKDFMNQLQKLKEELHERINVHDSQLNQIYEALENMLDEQIDKKTKELEWEKRERIGFKK